MKTKMLDAFNTEIKLVDSSIPGDLYMYVYDHDRNTNEVVIMPPVMQAELIRQLAKYMRKYARKNLD